MNKGTKINQLLQQLPSGSVLLSSWLYTQGYPYELQQRYRESGWLTSLGKGAMIRSGQRLLLGGAIYALQQQAELKIHPGGRTALGMQGFAHYLEISRKETLLFAGRGVKLPAWFINNKWDTLPVLITTSFLPEMTGLVTFDEKEHTIIISGAARAMLECIELTPRRFDLTEASELMEGLNLLKPETAQVLLEQCRSVKAKRLFLYFAERAGHSWFNHLQLDKIDLGKGKRSIVPGGVLIPKYQITLPEHLT
jgi:hypothetical protein